MPLPIDVLDVGAAQTLLTRGIDSHAIDAAGWIEIVEWVGRLPLALVLLRGALDAGAFTAGELLSRARSAATTAVLDQAMEALRPALAAGSLRGITEALAISYEVLPDRAKTAARLIAWLAPAPVPEAMREALGEPFDPTVRSMLVHRSLVSKVRDAAVPMFGSMHRVLGDFLRTKSKDSAGELTGLTRALLTVMSDERIKTPSEWEWSLMEACKPHAGTLLNHVAAQQPRIDFVDHIALLTRHLASWYLTQGLPAEASELTLGALATCALETEPGRLVVDTSRPGVRALTQDLAPVLAQNGEHDAAIQLQRSYLEWLEQAAKRADPEVLAARDNLALWLHNRGHAEDLEEAHQILERTIPAWRRHDPSSLDTLTALNNLGLVEQKRGNTEQAIVLFKEVLEGVKRLQLVDREAIMDMIQTSRNLASTLWETNPELAGSLLEEALAAADRIPLSDKHPVKLDTLKRLGGRAHQRGDYAQAQPLLWQTVQALAATRGDHDSETTIYAWALWDAQLRSDDITPAAETRRRYLDWIRETAEQLTPEQQRIRADVLRRAGEGR